MDEKLANYVIQLLTVLYRVISCMLRRKTVACDSVLIKGDNRKKALQKKKAYPCRREICEFKVMSFGQFKAPAGLKRIIEWLLTRLPWYTCLIFGRIAVTDEAFQNK